MAQLVKNPPAIQETWVWSLGWEDPLEKGKGTHLSILAWKVPWTLPSMGSQRGRHDWATFNWWSCYLLFLRELNDALLYIKYLELGMRLVLWLLLLLLHVEMMIFLCLSMTTGSKMKPSMLWVQISLFFPTLMASAPFSLTVSEHGS